MANQTSQFIREYQRKSKSPWDDHSTVLLLANYEEDDNDNIELNFSRYIYQHRDSAGRILGISVSKSILEEHPEFEGQYLEGIDMYIVLLLLIDEITTFCSLFSEEFKAMYGMPPKDFFEVSELYWAEILNSSL